MTNSYAATKIWLGTCGMALVAIAVLRELILG